MKALMCVVLAWVVLAAGCSIQVSVGPGPVSGGLGASPDASQEPAKGEGWVEVAILDESVPCPADRPEAACLAPECSLEVLLNGERWALQQFSAHGGAPPFRVDGGFRFPAPAGQMRAEVVFLCKEDSELQAAPLNRNVTAACDLEVQAGKVSSLSFDGENLTFLGVREDQGRGLEHDPEDGDASGPEARTLAL